MGSLDNTLKFQEIIEAVSGSHDVLFNALKILRDAVDKDGKMEYTQMRVELDKLCNDLIYIRDGVTKFRKYEKDLGKSVLPLKSNVEDIVSFVRQLSGGSSAAELIDSNLQQIAKHILNLRYEVSLAQKLSSARSDANRKFHNSNGVKNRSSCHELPSLHMDEHFGKTSVFVEIQQIFGSLEINERACLLCFAVFPENAVVKKTILMHWWIAEGFVCPQTDRETVEETVKGMLKKFTAKGLLEPVNGKRKLGANSFKMPPTVRSAVITLAKKAEFFAFDDKGNPALQTSFWKKACLVERRGESYRQVPENLEKLETLFNVSERFPDFTFKWFLKMKELKVLYLGRWESTAERHIEVENTEHLKDLRYMKQLRLLSFRGISRIGELPSSICKLPNLTILDLRACYNLEELPDKIDSLKNLTHLDISECYQLDRMPKKLSSLSKLEVLQGFVISDADKGGTCTLEEISKLENLRKLSININTEAFMLEELINGLRAFKALRSLKVAWGGKPKTVTEIQEQKGGEIKPNTEKQDKKGDKRNKEDGAASSITTNRETVAENKKKEDNAAESTAKTQDLRADNKQQDSGCATSTSGNVEKRGNNEEGKSSATESLASNMERKENNEIEEVSEAESRTKNEERGQIGATKSMDSKQEMKGTLGVKPAAVTEDKNNKKKVEFAVEEPKTTDVEMGEAAKNQETGPPKSMASNQDSGQDKCNKKLQRNPSRLTKTFRRTATLAMMFSPGQQKEESQEGPRLPSQLRKLELQCFPVEKAPIWLMPARLTELKKLYIRGGRLRSLGEIPQTESKCAVQILRLKYLRELKLNWKELLVLFPQLEYFESFGSPKITFCPCDGHGVWESQSSRIGG